MQNNEKKNIVVETKTDELYNRLKEKATGYINYEGEAFGHYLEVQKVIQHIEILDKAGVTIYTEEKVIALNLAIRSKKEVYLEFDFVKPIDKNQVEIELNHILSWTSKLCLGKVIMREIEPKRLFLQNRKILVNNKNEKGSVKRDIKTA